MKQKVLIADDEEKIREVVRLYLEKDGFETGEAVDGEDALRAARDENWDLILLDVMMPKMDGIKVCQEIRKTDKVPIIMLTAKNDEFDRIFGLELGADDYVGKPFSPRELVARVKAVLRRKGDVEPDLTLKFPGLTINMITREISQFGRSVTLTQKEFSLLSLLAQSPGRVYSRDQLMELIWGYDYFGDSRTVDTHINRLRDKLKGPDCPTYIQTVWGQGYRFEVIS